MACDYCDNREEDVLPIPCNEDDPKLVLDVTDCSKFQGRSYMNVRGHDSAFGCNININQTWNINYCPMCGRRLV